jgi:hypothetical protein
MMVTTAMLLIAQESSVVPMPMSLVNSESHTADPDIRAFRNDDWLFATEV